MGRSSMHSTTQRSTQPTNKGSSPEVNPQSRNLHPYAQQLGIDSSNTAPPTGSKITSQPLPPVSSLTLVLKPGFVS